MRIGDHDVGRDRALQFLRDYAVDHADTVRLYDLAGDLEGRPGPGSAAEPVTAVSLADIGRLVVINAGLAAADVATLMDIDAAAEFAAVPAIARLEQCEPGSDLYQAATALYEKYRLLKGSNIGQAKRSKLLHLKRPWLVPIADTRVISVYRRRADRWAAELGISSGHWEAVREDLSAAVDDFEWLTAALSDCLKPEVRLLGRLTSLRLLDILAWMIGDS
jgi:uncharacterized protein DUF6308